MKISQLEEVCRLDKEYRNVSRTLSEIMGGSRSGSKFTFVDVMGTTLSLGDDHALATAVLNAIRQKLDSIERRLSDLGVEIDIVSSKNGASAPRSEEAMPIQ